MGKVWEKLLQCWWPGQRVFDVEALVIECGTCGGQLSTCAGRFCQRFSAILRWTYKLHKQSAQELGLDVIAYQARPDGHCAKNETIETVKKRGRWASDKSAKRYHRREWSKVTVEQRSVCLCCKAPVAIFSGKGHWCVQRPVLRGHLRRLRQRRRLILGTST